MTNRAPPPYNSSGHAAAPEQGRRAFQELLAAPHREDYAPPGRAGAAHGPVGEAPEAPS